MKKAKKITAKDGFSTGKGSLGVSLGSLLRGNPEPVEQRAEPERQKEAPTAKGIAGIPRVALQRQTAGRGGKTVTLVIIPRDTPTDLEALAKEMRRGLGCGSRVEEGRVVLQGDICDRAAEWLEKKGVKKIARGN